LLMLTLEGVEMGSFKSFNERLVASLEELSEVVSHLFVVDVTGDELWDTYLDSFPPGANEIYRTRREHDCSCCRSFIRQFGAVVGIVDNHIESIWHFDAQDEKFQPSIDALDSLVTSRAVVNVFVTKQAAFGTDHSNELLEDGSVHQWSHFRAELLPKFVTQSSKTEGTIAAGLRASKEVLERSLLEIDRDAVSATLDMITENVLYKGQEWFVPLKTLLAMQLEYAALSSTEERGLYCWTKSLEVGPALSRIKNHSIGVLLQDITKGVDVMDAVKRYESIVAPENYKRPREIFTKRMVQTAQATVVELGLENSLPRRFARLTDVTVNNVLFADRDAVRVMDQGGVFEQMMEETVQTVGSFSGAEPIGIDEFLRDHLPTTQSIEVLLENQHATSMVSLIAPIHRDAPSLFKWDNPFSWAYSGNLTDSTMRERVKALGGKVEGALRFTLQWNESGKNHNDFDAHCIEPGGFRVFYAQRHGTTGELDVDIIHPLPSQVAVENIIITTPRMGAYEFLVRNFSQRDGTDGFRVEIEFGGKLYEFDYSRAMRQSEFVSVAKLQFGSDGFKMNSCLSHNASSKQVWGLNTQHFHRVSLVTFSPNFWNEQKGIGHRHVFFMLAGANNDETPNGFYNEFVRQEFMPHKRVFAALGSRMKVSDDVEQLSGVGFSTTRRASVIVRIDHTQMFKVVF